MPNMWNENREHSLKLMQNVTHRKFSSTLYPLVTQKAFEKGGPRPCYLANIDMPVVVLLTCSYSSRVKPCAAEVVYFLKTARCLSLKTKSNVIWSMLKWKKNTLNVLKSSQ